MVLERRAQHSPQRGAPGQPGLIPLGLSHLFPGSPLGEHTTPTKNRTAKSIHLRTGYEYSGIRWDMKECVAKFLSPVSIEASALVITYGHVDARMGVRRAR